MKELFVASNPIESAKEFQWGIAMADPEEAPVIAGHAKEIMRSVDEAYIKREFVIHTLSAYTLNIAELLTEQMVKDRLDEMLFSGRYYGTEYVQTENSDPPLQTLMAYIWPARIIAPDMERFPSGEITEPILVPVLDVQSVEMAA